jgi:hypothetical protein
VAAMTVDASTTAFITLPELMREANIVNADQSTMGELELRRAAAEEVVESIVGPILWRSVTETLDAGGLGILWLSESPVLSVQSLAVTGGGMLTYTRDGGTITLASPWGYAIGRGVTVTYTVGRSSCPARFRMAGLIIAKHLWETQLGNSPSTGAFDNDEGTTVIAGYAIPNRALELLVPPAAPQISPLIA